MLVKQRKVGACWLGVDQEWWHGCVLGGRRTAERHGCVCGGCWQAMETLVSAGWVLRKRSVASQTNRNDVSHVTARCCFYFLRTSVHVHNCETAEQEQQQVLLTLQLAFK